MDKQKIEPIYDNTFSRSKRRSQFSDHHFHWGWLILVLIIVAGLGIWTWHNHRTSALKSYPVRGVTISQDDGYLDFHELQDAKLKFVYLKGTSGASYTDDSFNDNYARAIGTTMQVGVYQDFSFTSSAEKQYEYFISQVKQNSGNLPIAIHVTYYGDSADHKMDNDKQGKKLAKLVSLLASHYGQGVVVWTTPEIQRKIVSPHVHYAKRWLIMSRLKRSTDATFMEYTGRDKLTVNGQKMDLTQVVYNDSLKSWKDAW